MTLVKCSAAVFSTSVMAKLRKINDIKAVLIDLSGTLHIDDVEVPGSVAALNRLKATGIQLKYVTNTTKESKRILHDRLTKLGFTISRDEIFTSLTAARQLVETRGVRPLLMIDPKAMEEFEGISQERPNAVVVGLAPNHFNYNTMNEAFRLILDGATLIAIHKARYYKRKDDLALGPGPFVAGLEFATDTKAEVVGKPEKAFFTSAIKAFGCDIENCIMIGDDVRDDVGGAQSAGMNGILVKTGKYREGDERKIDPPPYRTVANFAEAVDHIVNELS